MRRRRMDYGEWLVWQKRKNIILVGFIAGVLTTFVMWLLSTMGER